MRQDDLYDIFVNIDEKYIDEARNKQHKSTGFSSKSVKQKNGTGRIKLLVLAVSTVLLIVSIFAVFSIVDHNVYADSGKEFKNFILTAIEPREIEYIELSPEEEAEIQRKLNSMDHRFAVPDGFMSIDGLSRVYYSEINGYENKKEWLALSVEERNAISQVPEELLKTMPTNALIITCLNYNFLGDIGLVDSSANVLDTMKEQYNGLEELCKRSDAGTELVRFLSCFDAKKFSENDRIPSIRFSYLMMILCDKNILGSLNSAQAKEWISQLNRLGGEINKEELISLSEISVFLPIMRCLYFNDPSARKVINSDSALKNFVVNLERFSGVSRFSDISTGKLWKIIKEDYYDAE